MWNFFNYSTYFSTCFPNSMLDSLRGMAKCVWNQVTIARIAWGDVTEYGAVATLLTMWAWIPCGVLKVLHGTIILYFWIGSWFWTGWAIVSWWICELNRCFLSGLMCWLVISARITSDCVLRSAFGLGQQRSGSFVLNIFPNRCNRSWVHLNARLIWLAVKFKHWVGVHKVHCGCAVCYLIIIRCCTWLLFVEGDVDTNVYFSSS